MLVEAINSLTNQTWLNACHSLFQGNHDFAASNTMNASLLSTSRAEILSRLEQNKTYDLAILGGGATGLGIAVDAVLRGWSVVLLESHDFAKGTSSRSTKLVHGGVRYLAQGNVSLVREALRERAHMLRNAAHLAQPLPFVLPTFRWWETPFYGAGLKAYDLLAGEAGLGRTEFLNVEETCTLLPTLRTQGLNSGIKYWDGLFDDARFALALARTAASHGALLVNYCTALCLVYEKDRVTGVKAKDSEGSKIFHIHANCVINATGVWVDDFRQKDSLIAGCNETRMISPSQGLHLVVDREFFPSDHGMIIPKTADGRVLFAVPWMGKVILGTTDTPREDYPREPEPLEGEVSFILNESARYLRQRPQITDIRSMWAGLRPLVKPTESIGTKTKNISREHSIEIKKSGLVTVTGGKWTTYRSIAEEVLDKVIQAGLLLNHAPCSTSSQSLIGSPNMDATSMSISAPAGNHLYGSEEKYLCEISSASEMIAPGLSEAMVRFAARYEYARNVEDVLARRNRLLFIDADAAMKVADIVADILSDELEHPVSSEAFIKLARQYSPSLILN